MIDSPFILMLVKRSEEIMKGWNFDSRDCMWIFSHTGINAVNIDVAMEARNRGMKVIVYGSAAEAEGKKTRHSSGLTLFELADIVVDTCVPVNDAYRDGARGQRTRINSRHSRLGSSWTATLHRPWLRRGCRKISSAKPKPVAHRIDVDGSGTARGLASTVAAASNGSPWG